MLAGLSRGNGGISAHVAGLVVWLKAEQPTGGVTVLGDQ